MTTLMDRPAPDLQEPADGLKSPATPDRNTPDGCSGGEDCFYCTCPETD